MKIVINTAVSYNLWGHNIQNVVFNISALGEVKTLNFSMGGETGCSGSVSVEDFLDKTLEDEPDYTYDLEASAIPTQASIVLNDEKSLTFFVTNHSGHEIRLVFFDFLGETE